MNDLQRLEDLVLAEHERADVLAGQVSALKAICFALVATHSNPAALRDVLCRVKEISIAKALGGSAPDAMIAEIERLLDAALRSEQKGSEPA
jgi:hypothetical protein